MMSLEVTKMNNVCVLTPIDGGEDLYNKILDTCNKLINAGKDVEWNSYIVMHLAVPELLLFTFQQKLMYIELLSGIDIVYLMAGWEAVPTNKLVYKTAKQLGIKIVSLQEKGSNINTQDTIFISGPISNVPNYRANFKRAQKYLKSLGYKNIINPAKIAKLIPDSVSYDDALRIDLNFLSVCNKIYMLNNWERSTGASTEIKYAEKHGIEIIFEDYEPIEV